MASPPVEDTFVDCGVAPALRRFCKRCGFFRVHGHPCVQCTINGHYPQREITSETMKIVVEMINNKAPGHELRDYLEQHLLTVQIHRGAAARKDPRSGGQMSTAHKRILTAKQIRLLTILLNEITKVFEPDERGELQIFEDRMPEARAYIKMAQRFVPELMRKFKMPGAPKRVVSKMEIKKGTRRNVGRKRKAAF